MVGEAGLSARKRTNQTTTVRLNEQNNSCACALQNKKAK